MNLVISESGNSNDKVFISDARQSVSPHNYNTSPSVENGISLFS